MDPYIYYEKNKNLICQRMSYLCRADGVGVSQSYVELNVATGFEHGQRQ